MKILRQFVLLAFTMLLLPFISHGQWTTVGDEVEMTDIADNVLIGTTDNSSTSTSTDDAKLLVKSDNNGLRSVLRAEADYDVPSAEEVLRLVMPSTSSVAAQFIDMKKGSTTVFEVERDGDVNVAGDVDVVGELTAVSDARFKENVSTIHDAMLKVMLLRPVSYDFRTEQFPDLKLPRRKKHGLIAQEVEAVLPTLVSSQKEVTDVNGTSFVSKSVNYLEVIPLLIKAVQEQQVIIEDLAKRLGRIETE